MRHFRFHGVGSLPRLAWCAVIDDEQSAVDVFHGSAVETSQDYFVEGAWEAPFEAGGFDESPTFMGSGGKRSGHGILFSTPCHTVERLHLVRVGSRAFVSNSLAFVMRQSGSSLDPGYPGYVDDLESIVKGLQEATKTIPLVGGHRVHLYYHCNVHVDSFARIQISDKKAPPHFDDFKSYRSFLSGTLDGLFRNAASRARSVSYTPLSAMSSGYDSSAGATLAREAGCEKAITFRKARSTRFHDSSVDDSGREIAQALGLDVAELDREAYLDRPGAIAAEFAAVGLCGEMPMSACEEQCRNTILTTGFYGDNVWGLRAKRVTPYIVRGVAVGLCLQEFRLRVGFIHVPVPFLGCVRHPEIHRISASEEMKPWVVGSKRYDRPIPRRILEEAGVERGAFAREKMAACVLLPACSSFEELRRGMNSDSFRSLKDFYDNDYKHRFSRSERSVTALRQSWYGVATDALNYFWRRNVPVLSSVVRGLIDRLRLGGASLTDIRFFQPLLFHWGIAVTRERYDTGQREGAQRVDL